MLFNLAQLLGTIAGVEALVLIEHGGDEDR